MGVARVWAVAAVSIAGTLIACAQLVKLDDYGATVSGSDASSGSDTASDAPIATGDDSSADALPADDAGPDPWDAAPVVDAIAPDACSNTNLNTDNFNCGVCGHACAPGAVCSGGVCAAVPVATATSPTEIAVDGTYVFWLDTTAKQVFRRKKDGSDTVTSIHSAPNGGMRDVAATDTNVAFSQAPENQVFVTNLDGGVVASPVTAGGPAGVALDSTMAYVANVNDGRVQSVRISNGATSDLVPSSGGLKPAFVAVSIDHLYYGGTAPTSFVRGTGLGVTYSYSATPSEALRDVQAYARRGCWLTFKTIRCEASGADLVVISNETDLRRFAVDSSGFYFSRKGSTVGTATISRCPLSGCNATSPPFTLANATDPIGVAVDAQYVYWADQNGGIWRTPK